MAFYSAIGFPWILLIIVDSSALFGLQRCLPKWHPRDSKWTDPQKPLPLADSLTDGRKEGRALEDESSTQLLRSAVNSHLIPDASPHKILQGSIVEARGPRHIQRDVGIMLRS